MEAVKDPSHLLKIDRIIHYAERSNFRIAELEISRNQKVPWHYHNSVQDTFYVVEGQIRIFVRDPKAEILLAAGEVYSVAPRRPHLVTNAGEKSAVFLVLQAGAYDFVPLD